MKLIFPLSNKQKIGYVFIGHKGVIRFNAEFSRLFNLQQGQKWKIGYDDEDKNRTFMYFFKCVEEEEGITMGIQHSNHLLFAKRFTDLFNVEPHSYYGYEAFSLKGNEGFRVKIVPDPLKPKKYNKAKSITK